MFVGSIPIIYPLNPIDFIKSWHGIDSPLLGPTSALLWARPPVGFARRFQKWSDALTSWLVYTGLGVFVPKKNTSP